MNIPYVKQTTKKKRKKNDIDLYEVEIKEVDRKKGRIKIHFKGYHDRYDEWRPVARLERIFIASCESIEGHKEKFFDRLYRQIKRALYSGRKEDPEVRIELPINEDIFRAGISLSGIIKSERGKEVYRILSNRDLDNCLNFKWDERIQNENGDFAYVVPGTVKFWIIKRAPIVEYKLIGGKSIRSEIEE